jgi:TetR/AcrR family transcriptional regulator, transcriptional repressor for nem operon
MVIGRQINMSGEKRSLSPALAKLLEASICAIRAQGYSATAVDDICRRAGVTKGSFFHYFKSKDDLAIAAVAHWRAMTETLYSSAPYHHAEDPLDRLLGYIDFRNDILTGELPSCTCLLGTLVQETYDTHPAIRRACEQALTSHIAELTRYVAEAKSLHAPAAAWSAESAGNFIEAALQGSFILAKANHSPEVIRENLEHVRRYLRFLFQHPEQVSVFSEIHSEEESPDSSKSHYTD